MIWGVPLGTQTLHVDVDLSDIGCFSLRPDDFIRQGKGVDNFKNNQSSLSKYIGIFVCVSVFILCKFDLADIQKNRNHFFSL